MLASSPLGPRAKNVFCQSNTVARAESLKSLRQIAVSFNLSILLSCRAAFFKDKVTTRPMTVLFTGRDGQEPAGHRKVRDKSHKKTKAEVGRRALVCGNTGRVGLDHYLVGL